MNISFSTDAFRYHTLRETFGVLAGLGYRGVEIMADIPHAHPSDLDSNNIENLRNLLARHHLRVANVNAFTRHDRGDIRHPSWIDPDPAARDERIDHTLRCIDLAVGLGTPHLLTEPGGPLPAGMSRRDGLDLFRRGLRRVEGRARERGVRILFGPEPGQLIETEKQFTEFYRTLDPVVFGLNFDIGHFYCAGEDPAVQIRNLRGAIGHFHLEDIPSSRRHVHLIPGEGAIDFRDIFIAIKEIDYRGYVTVELHACSDRPAEAAERSLRFLRRMVLASSENRELGNNS